MINGQYQVAQKPYDKMKNPVKQTIAKIMIIVRRTIYIFFANLDKHIFHYKPGIIILCYHNIGNDSWNYTIKLSDFKKQIEFLLENFKILNPENFEFILKENRKVEKPMAMITFDDGYKNLIKLKKFFAQRKINPILFVTENREEINRTELDCNLPLLTDKEILELQKSGWIIGCHSATHSDFSLLNMANMAKEIIESKKNLEKNLGIKINYFSYPKGKYTSKILSMVKQNYKMAFSMNSDYVRNSCDHFMIPRIGIVQSHSLAEFKAQFYPSVLLIKRIIFNNILSKLLLPIMN